MEQGIVSSETIDQIQGWLFEEAYIAFYEHGLHYDQTFDEDDLPEFIEEAAVDCVCAWIRMRTV